MARKKEWFIYIEDYDTKKYCIAGPVTADNCSDWFDIIEAEQTSGRNIHFQEIQHSQLEEIPDHAKSNGLTVAQTAEIIHPPKDRSSEYVGSLPQYARRADRSKLVQMLCKGKCRTTRWAVLNKKYPGKDELKRAEFGEYKATCLKCGYEASYNYNWYRP